MAMGYFSPSLGPDTVPDFLSSQTARGLRRKMLRNNIRHKGFVVYQDIQFVDGLWYAWYYVKIDSLNDPLNESSQAE